MVVEVVIWFWAVCSVRLLLVVMLVVVLRSGVAVACVGLPGAFPVRVAARAEAWVRSLGWLFAVKVVERPTWPRCCCPVVVVVVVVAASLGQP